MYGVPEQTRNGNIRVSHNSTLTEPPLWFLCLVPLSRASILRFFYSSTYKFFTKLVHSCHCPVHDFMMEYARLSPLTVSSTTALRHCLYMSKGQGNLIFPDWRESLSRTRVCFRPKNSARHGVPSIGIDTFPPLPRTDAFVPPFAIKYPH